MKNQKLVIEVTYQGSNLEALTLPEGQVWDDVEHWYVRWDVLYVKFKGVDTIWQFPLDTNLVECVEMKRPITARIYEINSDNEVDWDKQVDSHE